jgi:hypothetical protein
MRRLALTLLCPTLVAAQEARQQAASPEMQKWREVQVALAADAAGTVKRKQQLEKSLVELDRREKAVFQAMADVFRVSDPQGVDARLVRETGEQRRPRVEADERSATRLDSIRRAGTASDILAALTLRQQLAERWALETPGILRDWKDLQRRTELALSNLKSDDNPSNPADRKALIKALIDHHERLLKLTRGTLDFESTRGDELRSEAAALLKQIEAAKGPT